MDITKYFKIFSELFSKELFFYIPDIPRHTFSANLFPQNISLAGKERNKGLKIKKQTLI